ncbi:unnamed protein product, partial [Tenebrio molitor]
MTVLTQREGSRKTTTFPDSKLVENGRDGAWIRHFLLSTIQMIIRTQIPSTKFDWLSG